MKITLEKNGPLYQIRNKGLVSAEYFLQRNGETAFNRLIKLQVKMMTEPTREEG